MAIRNIFETTEELAHINNHIVLYIICKNNSNKNNNNNTNSQQQLTTRNSQLTTHNNNIKINIIIIIINNNDDVTTHFLVTARTHTNRHLTLRYTHIDTHTYTHTRLSNSQTWGCDMRLSLALARTANVIKSSVALAHKNDAGLNKSCLALTHTHDWCYDVMLHLHAHDATLWNLLFVLAHTCTHAHFLGFQASLVSESSRIP